MSSLLDIFRANDLRGEYPREINRDIALATGKSFREILDKIYKHPLKIVVGYDNRKSSPSLAKAFISGFYWDAQHYSQIQRIGLTTTPLFCFSLIREKADGGAMITASHNPFSQNGILLYLKGAQSFLSGEKWDKKFRKLVLKNYTLVKEQKIKEGSEKVHHIDYLKAYLSYLQKFIDIKRPLSFGIDDGGGTIRSILPKFLSLPQWGKVKFSLIRGPKWRFADPTKRKNSQALARLIRMKHLDGGVLFDSDGDRAVFLNEKGRPVHPDRIFALLSLYFLRKYHRATFVNTILLNEKVKELIKGKGGKLAFSSIGYGFVQEKMKKYDALCGGEISGHYYYRDFSYRDDALLTLIYVLNILGSSKDSFSQLEKNIPLNPTCFFSFPYHKREEAEKTLSLLKTISQQLSFRKKMTFRKFDGFNWRTKNWRMNWRLSKTENYIRVYWEQLGPSKH